MLLHATEPASPNQKQDANLVIFSLESHGMATNHVLNERLWVRPAWVVWSDRFCRRTAGDRGGGLAARPQICQPGLQVVRARLGGGAA
jgi:hypothetical protein